MERVKEAVKSKSVKITSGSRRKEESYDSLKKFKKKLISENRKKQELYEVLMKSQNQQMVLIQEAVFKIENRALQLIDKETANDKPNKKNEDQEQKIHAFQEEINGLKGLLAVPEDKKAKASKDLSDDGDQTLLQLEEKNRKIKEKLKLKKEEFKSLEQRNEKLAEKFSNSEKEQGMEKSSLLDVIATLQDASPSGAQEMEFPAADLDQEYQELLKKGTKSSVTNLKMKLRAMEHKYRDCSKALEVKEGEWSLQMENVTSELNQCKSELEGKDRAIEELMVELESSCSLMMDLQQCIKKTADDSLQMEKVKEDLCTCRSELEYKDTAIEDMMLELESCHSLMTDVQLQNEEWSSLVQTTKRRFDQCSSELASKDKAIEELMVELESCHSLMTELQLRVETSEMAQQLEKIRKDFNECRDESESKSRTIEEQMRKLEDYHSLVMRLKLQCEESEWSSHWAMMASQFDDYRPEVEGKDRTKEELLKELEDCHSQIMESMLQNEGASLMVMTLKAGISEASLKLISKEKEREEKVKMYEVMLIESSRALEEANSELKDKICEVHEIEFELQIWKCFADRLRANLEENYEMRKELEASLLEEIEVEETFKEEKNGLLLLLDEKHNKVNSSQQQTVTTDQEQTRERSQ